MDSKSKGNGQYPIEKGIAMKGWGGLRCRFNFGAMEEGDSFIVPLADGLSKRQIANRVGVAANAWKKKHGGNFATRAVDGGVRCWRTA